MNRLSFIWGIALVSLTLSALGCGGGSSNGDESTLSETTAEEAAVEAAEAAGEAAGEAAEAAGEAAEAPAESERPIFVAPIRGIAEVAYLTPDTEVIDGEVITRITIQNRATGAIAGLKVDEFWYDSDGNTVGGDSQRHRQPLLVGEVVTIELRMPRNSRMNRNQIQFSHANGEIKATNVDELPDPEEEEEEEEETESES
ncbi:uncharacterized protein METZ01_LOCUS2619 [marine metagenome]|uniref:Uncharacterized protein n=1 Tax=marine metagenome TaxID=408172 RepID=A0A381N5E4_9ZZZZ